MATERQIESNRLNAQKSTGPRTEEGKKKVSLNGMTHGLTAQVILLTPEEAPRYHAFLTQYIEAWKPKGLIERRLAEHIAENEYRLSRAFATEHNVYAAGHPGEIDEGDRPEVVTAFANAKTFLAAGDKLQGLTLYEQRIRRAIEKDTVRLEKLQAERKTVRAAALEQAQNFALMSYAQGEAYDPAEDFPAEFGFGFSNEEINAKINRERRLIAVAKAKKAGYSKESLTREPQIPLIGRPMAA